MSKHKELTRLVCACRGGGFSGVEILSKRGLILLKLFGGGGGGGTLPPYKKGVGDPRDLGLPRDIFKMNNTKLANLKL